jgi:hypothetical protein
MHTQCSRFLASAVLLAAAGISDDWCRVTESGELQTMQVKRYQSPEIG